MEKTLEDTDFLEELYADDCKCESRHTNIECSLKVTHVAYSRCGVYPHKKICLNAAKRDTGTMKARPIIFCAGCYTPAKDCWIINLI